MRRSADIVRILREGKPLRSERVVVYVAPGPQESRAAWVVGRRVGTAVARNRARRILREAWRAIAEDVREGNDVVLVARPTIRGAGSMDLVQEIGEVLARAGLMRRSPGSPGMRR